MNWLYAQVTVSVASGFSGVIVSASMVGTALPTVAVIEEEAPSSVASLGVVVNVTVAFFCKYVAAKMW